MGFLLSLKLLIPTFMEFHDYKQALWKMCEHPCKRIRLLISCIRHTPQVLLLLPFLACELSYPERFTVGRSCWLLGCLGIRRS